jgi:hypothetical protein
MTVYVPTIPVDARSKAWVCGRSLAGITGSNPTGGMDVVSVVCCQVAVTATSCSPVQRSPTECGVTECEREATTVRRRRPSRGCRAVVKN